VGFCLLNVSFQGSVFSAQCLDYSIRIQIGWKQTALFSEFVVHKEG
jgi:hypothetical protein